MKQTDIFTRVLFVDINFIYKILLLFHARAQILSRQFSTCIGELPTPCTHPYKTINQYVQMLFLNELGLNAFRWTYENKSF